MKKSFLLFLVVATLLVVAPQVSSQAKVKADSSKQVAMVFGSGGTVLGDDDSEKEHEEEREREEEQEREREDEHKEEEEEQEREREEEHESEREFEHEEEREGEESHTEETIRSANGTTTYIKRESDSEKTEVELKTYDASGKLVEERKLKQESEEGERKELEFEQYLYNQGDLQELKIKSAQGKELEITVREKEEGTTNVSKLEYDATEQKLKINDEEQGRHVTISPEQDHFLLDDGTQSARVGLPLTIDAESGEVFVDTVVGLVKVGISPDKAREIIETSQANTLIDADSISLEEGGNGLEYRISLQKQERLLGLFPITLNSVQAIDAETGELSNQQQDLATRFLDLFSF